MDGSDQPSLNSKVIVQCTDPYDLFERVKDRLSARSPLRNLHWKAANRPLRSIPNLNLSFTREDTSASANGSARRHQIPGLRATPYVKVLLVRCDDKETYKEKVRKDVRQWVKANAASEGKSSSKSQDGHDAFEWLILHVVLPGTPAASQPRSTKHISIEASESTDSVNSKSKWPGQGTSTIFDKLRADFSSSKSSSGRVAQIRLRDESDRSTALTPAELEEQWQDLVERLKTYILQSFGVRVAQYEADIREREGQRTLPGWNFCTFFVLKEGLAKGFENLGLLEDAMAVYGELSLGLDAMVKEQGDGDNGDDSGSLLTFSKDAKGLLRTALSEGDRDTVAGVEDVPDLASLIDAERRNFPFDIERKNYRNLILTNQVSVLDLRIYLFTQELDLLSRKAKLDSKKSLQAEGVTSNPEIIADLLERAMRFISLASLTLRFELYHAWGGQEGLSHDELQNQSMVIDNIVSTWQWQATMQILGQTLPKVTMDEDDQIDTLTLHPVELSEAYGLEASGSGSNAKNDLHRPSLNTSVRVPSRERSAERPDRAYLSSNAQSRLYATSPAQQRLLLWVAKLLLMARHIVENLEGSKLWMVKLKYRSHRTSQQRPHGINGHKNGANDERPISDPNADVLAGIASTTLRMAADSGQIFFDLVTMLSVSAFRLAARAQSRNTARQILTTLAEIEASKGKNLVAVRYLQPILGPLPCSSTSKSDSTLLRMYADCLEELDRPDDLARALISCVGCSGRDSTMGPAPSTDYVQKLFGVLPHVSPTTLPVTCLFRISNISKAISPSQDTDGFSMSFDIGNIAGPNVIPVDGVKLRLVANDATEPRYIHMTSSAPVVVKATATTAVLGTPVTTHGWYSLDEVEVNIGKLRLVHHFKRGGSDESEHADEPHDTRENAVPILLYPSTRSLALKMYPFPVIHLAEPRRLLLQVRPGENDVEQCRLRLRTATAGLRLHIYEAKLAGSGHESEQFQTAREGDTSLMILKDLVAGSLIDIEIPYSMEIASEPSINVRVEAVYKTPRGSFTFHDVLVAKVILPVTVNVQDVFRHDHMYSKFTISPSTMVPLRLNGCRLEGGGSYDVFDGGQFQKPLMVFPKQPANWTVKLTSNYDSDSKTQEKLTLVTDFQSLDGVILACLEKQFILDISKTQYAFAARILVAHLLDVVRTTWTEQDAELAGLLQEFEVWRYEDMDWPTVLHAFDRRSRVALEHWLRQWHATTTPIDLASADVPQRQLRLIVDIPPRPILVQSQLETNFTGPVTIGQPVVAGLSVQLNIKPEHSLEATFELVAPPESWLLGGWRKGHISLTTDPTQQRVVLFPQRLGHLLLPTISVKCRQRRQNAGKEEWTDVTCEVYNPGHARTVLVTPGLRNTTVEAFGSSSDGGTGRLLASTPRDTKSDSVMTRS